MDIAHIIQELYPDEASAVTAEINKLILDNQLNRPNKWIDETDVMLITYGDSIYKKYEQPLVTFNRFLKTYFDKVFTNIHFLPFFPFTSDDGFSVVDYYAINPDLGEWKDVINIAKDYNLMFDGVINHISAKSEWFIKYLSGDPAYHDFFIECDPVLDYSMVVRPRTLPLYYPFTSSGGIKNIWATFSDDQIDLNYKNPKVLLRILDVLITYAKNGARFLRLDAVGFIWKELGTSSIHLPQAHLIVSLIRQVLDRINSGVIIITETNVPHRENISYFGKLNPEAHLVYQFPLPPLVFHTFLSADSSKINSWLASLAQEEFPPQTAFFNFLSSHDGIGIRPVEGILSAEELDQMFKHVETMGGKINYRNNKDGSKSPYELNITYYDVLSAKQDDTKTRMNKFLAAHAILLALKGMPAIYINSFLANRNDYEGLKQSGINRRINRHKFDFDQILVTMRQGESEAYQVNAKLVELINIKKTIKAFHPDGSQELLSLGDKLVAFNRVYQGSKVMVIINISNQELTINYNVVGKDLYNQEDINDSVVMKPYQIRWIEVK